jgi:putative endonuclease
MYYVYVLQSLRDGKFYKGITANLKKRTEEHNAGKNFSTAPRRPFRLVYYEAYLLKDDALAREKYLKTSMGKRVLKKQLKNFIRLAKFDRISIDSVK